ncbi:MAG: DUF6982 domain-containing protein [Acidobacteriaceae bacterium]
MSHKIKFDKVVVQAGGRVFKGYIESQQWEEIEGLLVQGSRRLPDILRLRSIEDETFSEIPLNGLKAVFFVKSFDGQGTRHDLKFFSNAPMVHGIWVQLQFKDGEIMEGIVLNGMQHLVEPGFFVHPTDPDGNNKLIYVLKSALSDFRVLGVRSL